MANITATQKEKNLFLLMSFLFVPISPFVFANTNSLPKQENSFHFQKDVLVVDFSFQRHNAAAEAQTVATGTTSTRNQGIVANIVLFFGNILVFLPIKGVSATARFLARMIAAPFKGIALLFSSNSKKAE